MNIEIGRPGLILKGDYQGLFVQINDDRPNTGGFLILVCSDRTMTNGHDDWVKDLEELKGYFRASRWAIDWFES